MKNRNNKFIVGLLFILLMVAVLFVWRISTKAPTSIAITSISSDSPQIGEVVRFEVQIISDATDFTIIALPDTQHYSDAYPEIFHSQTQWIVENKDALNIVFVTHLGDIVQHDDTVPEEWVAADAAMSRLDDVVPYGVLPGNHDMQAGGRAEYYQKNFPASRYEDQEWWGGSFNQNKNNYQLFSTGGDDYLIIHLQYCPSMEAIDWADEIVRAYPKRKVLISTHAFLLNETTRLSHCQNRSDGDIAPSQMWKRLIKDNTNIFLVLSGHIPGVARRMDPQGRVVHQILVDYQDMENGGNGYLRIMTFQPANDRIQMTTYSPYLDNYLRDDANQFKLPFEMTSGSIPTGEITISNGTDECIISVEKVICELVLTIPGENEFRATYSGDVNYKRSSSPEILVFVAGNH